MAMPLEGGAEMCQRSALIGQRTKKIELICKFPRISFRCSGKISETVRTFERQTQLLSCGK